MRPIKTGLSYFPLDSDFFSDKDIKLLKARYGTDGITLYLYLLCEIYKNGYYMVINEDDLDVIADELNLKDGLISQVLAFLADRSLLQFFEVGTLAGSGNAEASLASRSMPNDGSKLVCSDTAITSPGIQRRYQKAVKERAKKTPIRVDGFWLLNEEETESFIKVTDEEGFSRKKEGFSRKKEGFSREECDKVNKSKVNNNIYILSSLRSDNTSVPDMDTIAKMWNELDGLGDIKPIRLISGRREESVRARLKQYGLEGFREAIDRIKESDFLQGKHGGRPWTITFDWFIRPNNFPKVLEGNYSNKSGSSVTDDLDSF